MTAERKSPDPTSHANYINEGFRGRSLRLLTQFWHDTETVGAGPLIGRVGGIEFDP